MMKKGQKVAIEYTVFLADGTEVDSNVQEPPLVFVVGQNQIFPALEQAVAALTVGESKKVLLAPEEAYGPVVPDAFRAVDVSAIPHGLRFAGAILGAQDPEGGVYPIRVHAIEEEKAVLDFNHPLAGQPLYFEVRLVEVRDS